MGFGVFRSYYVGDVLRGIIQELSNGTSDVLVEIGLQLALEV